MSVWFCIPSKRPLKEANACLEAWRDMGYGVAILRELKDGRPACANVCLPTVQYLGWARSVNLLIASTMAYEENVEWFVTGGDDYYPDRHKRAAEIASECRVIAAALYTRHFRQGPGDFYPRGTFGVMQPTGDTWSDRHGRIIERICGSPWMGREFCRRMYHGGGPLYNGYYHNFADEELQNVAQMLGVFWQRPDIVQEHRHWATKQPKSATHTGLPGDVRNMPEWARKINDPHDSDWERSKALFAKRKASGFPGHEPLEI